MIIPEKLKKGDTIGIICPSHVGGEEKYAGIIKGIESIGFRAKLGKNAFSSSHGYLASPNERADDLNAMVYDGEVKMMLFGGGFGGNELLPLIDYAAIRKNPKIFSSYSDGTSILTAVNSKCGLVTYYGQGTGEFTDMRLYDYCQFARHFMGQEERMGGFAGGGRWISICEGRCEGILAGGYTQNLALLLGGEYFSYDTDSKYLLFLEDHEKFSDVSAVSSYISHIEQSAFINNVSGLIFGRYSQEINELLIARLERFGRKYGVPVVYCDSFGHFGRHAILPVGMRAALDTGRKAISFW